MTLQLDTLDDSQRAQLESFLHGRPLVTKEDTVEVLCILQHVVSHNGVTSFPDTPADCFCGRRQHPDFQNSGDAIRFIVNATLQAIANHSPHGRSLSAPLEYEEPF